jgi:hypothetical protein
MFTMTIYAVGRTVIARGRSRAKEGWEDTLIRLHRDTLPPGEPPRRVICMTYHEGQTGSPTNMVILGHGPPAPHESTDQPLLVHTAPPQF